MAIKVTTVGGSSFTCDIHSGLQGAIEQYLKDGEDGIWCCDENEKKDERGNVVQPAAHHCTTLSKVAGWTITRLPDEPDPDPGKPQIPDHIKDKAAPPQGRVTRNG